MPAYNPSCVIVPRRLRDCNYRRHYAEASRRLIQLLNHYRSARHKDMMMMMIARTASLVRFSLSPLYTEWWWAVIWNGGSTTTVNRTESTTILTRIRFFFFFCVTKPQYFFLFGYFSWHRFIFFVYQFWAMVVIRAIITINIRIRICSATTTTRIIRCRMEHILPVFMLL